MREVGQHNLDESIEAPNMFITISVPSVSVASLQKPLVPNGGTDKGKSIFSIIFYFAFISIYLFLFLVYSLTSNYLRLLKLKQCLFV